MVRLPLARRSRILAACAIGSALALAALAQGLAQWVPLPARLFAHPSTVVRYADGSPMHVFLSGDDKVRIAADLARIDSRYVEALLRFEDKRFWDHDGVDGLAVVRAAFSNLRHGRVVSGASTITMQLVRLLEPRPRTLRSKVIEALRALQFERRMTKEEILEAYLSFISFGRNIEGVEAASWAYFGHGPERLAAEEIATLVAVPQRPWERWPSATNAARLRSARNQIASGLAEEGALTWEEEAPLAPVPSALRALPREALHAAYWLRSLEGDQANLQTTLDRGVQRAAERALDRARPTLSHRGIHNGSIVVLDHARSEVAALVGNFDFWDRDHGGQIAGFAVARSPGSALKPFVYALALDQAVALPEHLVADIPAAWAGYSPGNYDGRYAGLVRLEDALSQSLNVPFARLLSRVGVEPFLALLRQGGAASLRPEPGYYGLSATLGAAEVTPLELAGLYAALAQAGRARPVRWRPGGQEGVPRRVLSSGAAYLTRRALARRDRPDFPNRRRWSGAPASIHWKTGTSYGHRDAWAVGSGPRYTVAVWLGNFDNTPSADLVGADAAGPILFDLLEALADRGRPTRPLAPPADLAPVEVCSFSGFLPNPACPERRETLALSATVPTERCPYHVAVDVDLDRGVALNPSCRTGRRWERRSFLEFPSTLRRFLSTRHRHLPAPPALAAECEVAGKRGAPRILSPLPNQVLVLIPGVPPSAQEVPFEAESGSARAELAWFLDGEYLGRLPAQQPLWWEPEAGRHELVVVDELGSSTRRIVEVQSGA